MKTIIQSGNTYNQIDITQVHGEQLPPGNYILKYSQQQGYFLEKKDDFKLPSKIYGDHSIIDRWQKSYFNNSDKNMGIILSGLKGTGKTITSQMFCQQINMPVIMITEPFRGTDFIDYITKYQNVIIFVDEFEKIYSDKDHQQDLLSLMDGNYPTRFIFLFTVNTFRINEYLVNRLSRVKYRKDYTDLDMSIVDEIIDDMLVNKQHRESIYDFFRKINMWTFDLVTNLIKEMNLFNEDAIACGKHLNLECENAYYSTVEVVNGVEYECFDTQYSADDEDIEIHRRETDYLPPVPNPKNLPEGHPVLRHAIHFEVDLEDKDTILTYDSPTSFTVKNEVKKYEFKFRRASKNNLVF